MNKINVLIAGSTGYIGIQLTKLLTNHKNVNIKYLCGSSSVGKKISHYDKSLTKKKLPKIIKFNKKLLKDVDEKGCIRNYHLRQSDQKRHAVIALKSLNFRILAAGDSYNDISMLKEAHAGVLFCPPDSIKSEFSQFPVSNSYSELQKELCRAGGLIS